MCVVDEFINMVKNLSIEELEEIRREAKANLEINQYHYLGYILGSLKYGRDEKRVIKILNDILEINDIKAS
ncbi:hypothetical protein [Acetoanaerobium noterae]|uniref:hypothetical protein n=1 Tax=Acetoanaerobium noterae TaxID=745369 RepID=UPI00332B9EFE